MRVSLRVWICGILALLLLPSLATAQSSATGSLTGTVTDPSGGVLPGVTVLVTNPDTGVSQSTVTGSSGEWTVAVAAGRPLRADVRAERIQETHAQRRAGRGRRDAPAQRDARCRRDDRAGYRQRRCASWSSRTRPRPIAG